MGGDLEDEKAICSECKGTGQILLLISKARCLKCRGTGFIKISESDDGPEDFDDYYDMGQTGDWSMGWFYED